MCGPSLGYENGLWLSQLVHSKAYTSLILSSQLLASPSPKTTDTTLCTSLTIGRRREMKQNGGRGICCFFQSRDKWAIIIAAFSPEGGSCHHWEERRRAGDWRDSGMGGSLEVRLQPGFNVNFDSSPSTRRQLTSPESRSCFYRIYFYFFIFFNI